MVRVEVYVPAKFHVCYRLDVDDPSNLEEIISKLEETDPSDWAYDPDFYGEYGSNYREFIRRVTEDDVFILQK